jgi:hypothetical protein
MYVSEYLRSANILLGNRENAHFCLFASMATYIVSSLNGQKRNKVLIEINVY